MTTLFDQLDRSLVFDSSPKRIISLVPSLTELLVFMGLESSLIGCTQFCIHPHHIKEKCEVIGGTKNPKIQAIIDLKPDLILANQEENRKEDIDLLEKHSLSIYVSKIDTLNDLLGCLDDLQSICQLPPMPLIQPLKDQLNHLPVRLSATQLANQSCIYLIWNKPIMGVGHDTFIYWVLHHLLKMNVLCNRQPRYPEFELQEIVQMNPQHLFLSSEPYHFKESHVTFFKSHWKKTP